MKALLFAAAIAFGGTAMAQEMTPPAGSGTTTGDATTAPADATAPMATPTDAGTPADTAAPTTDSAMPMTAPDNAAPSDNKGMSTASTAPAGDYPMCSRTVTDKCVQGGKGTMKMHKKMHKKM